MKTTYKHKAIVIIGVLLTIGIAWLVYIFPLSFGIYMLVSIIATIILLSILKGKNKPVKKSVIFDLPSDEWKKEWVSEPITPQEPRILNLIRIGSRLLHDDKDELIPFLIGQYKKEMGRNMIHESFKDSYGLDHFDPTEMLSFYIDPLDRSSMVYTVQVNPIEGVFIIGRSKTKKS